MIADERPPAVLLGGSANALSAARSLHARGITVDAMGDGLGASPVQSSRAIRRFFAPTSGNVQQQWLEHLSGGRPSSAVLACCDDAVELIADHRSELRSMGHLIPPGDDSVLLAMLDKAQTALAAERAGVPAPAVVTVDGVDELVTAAESIGYPCGLKPLHSHRFTRANQGLKGAAVSDRDELLRLGEQLLERDAELLVTELIPGADPVFCSYNTYIDDDGTSLFEITKQKLRQHPIDFGLGTFHRTVDLPDVAKLGRRFLESSGMRGFGNVEFRRDARDGQLKLIECNVRLTAANELLTRAGCDAAWVVYARTIGEQVEPVIGFREGLRMWHPGRDVRAFWGYRKRGTLTWADWLSDVLPLPGLPLFSVRDPGPSLSVFRRKLQRSAHRLRSIREIEVA